MGWLMSARASATLLLAARELPRAPRAVVRESDELERFGDPLLLLVALDALLAEPVADVLRDGHVREQRVVLEHGVDVPAIRRDARDGLAVEEDLARGGLLEAGDHPGVVVFPQPDGPRSE